jgi:hypothetical protein
VLSRGNRTGHGPRLQRTSALCRRVDCLVAVNGDFFRSGAPVGGVVRDGRVEKSPRTRWRQAIFDPEGRFEARKISVRATLLTTDLRKIDIGHVNPARARHAWLALYGSTFGARTPRLRHAMVATFSLERPSGPLRIGQTSQARLERIARARGRRVRIPEDGFVVVGRFGGAVRLRDVARRLREGELTRDALVRLRTSPDAWDSVGGRPLLVRRGRIAVPNDRSAFATARHPRTIVGRTRDGSLLLVTVDGRQRHRAGMTIREAARLMVHLGAVEAMNLDGGGSTTFVTRGTVRNSPSDGHQRGVAVALAVVRATRDAVVPRPTNLSHIALPAPSPRLARAREPVRIVERPAAVPASSRLPWVLVNVPILALTAFALGIRTARRRPRVRSA